MLCVSLCKDMCAEILWLFKLIYFVAVLNTDIITNYGNFYWMFLHAFPCVCVGVTLCYFCGNREQIHICGAPLAIDGHINRS